MIKRYILNKLKNSGNNKGKGKGKNTIGVFLKAFIAPISGSIVVMSVAIRVGIIIVIMGGAIVYSIIDVYNKDENGKEIELSSNSDCVCGDCTQGYELINGSNSGTAVSTSGGGKKITDTTKNPYNLPLYDGSTLDAQALGVETWTIDFSQFNDTEIQKAVAQNTHTYMSYRTTGVTSTPGKILRSPHVDTSDTTPLRIVDGRLAVAVAQGVYSKIQDESQRYTNPVYLEDGDKSAVMSGRYMDVYTADGTVIACMITDVKKTTEVSKPSPLFRMFHKDGSTYSIVEMVTDDEETAVNSKGKTYTTYKETKEFLKQFSGNTGNYSNMKSAGISSPITKIVVYNAKYINNDGSFNPIFTNSINGNNTNTNSSNSDNTNGTQSSIKLTYSNENVDVENWDGNVVSEYPNVLDSCEPITINQHILPEKNYYTNNTGKISSFIIHYWGNPNDSAGEVNGDSLYSGWAKDGIKTSATFTMGTSGDIYQYVPLNKSPNTSNTNDSTISIEVANKFKNGKFTEAEYKNLVHLTAWLAYTYRLSSDFNWEEQPLSKKKYWDTGQIKRHYDTLMNGRFRGKTCPSYWTPSDGTSETPGNETAGGNLRWIAFKKDVTDYIIKYKDNPNFKPTNVDSLSGYSESLSLIDSSATPNWNGGKTIASNLDISKMSNEDILKLYRGKGCGCSIPCTKDGCNNQCHKKDAEEILKSYGRSYNNNNNSDNGTGGNNNSKSDSDGLAIGDGKLPHLNNGGEGQYWNVSDDGVVTFTGSTWQSTTFLKNARNVMISYVASGHGYLYGGYRNIVPFGIVRMDCSGYLTQVLKLTGYGNPNVTSGSDFTKQLGFSSVGYNEMQPGDIVVYNGHVDIFCGWLNSNSVGSPSYYAYSWGAMSDKTAYGNYIEPKVYSRSISTFKKAYRPVERKNKV